MATTNYLQMMIDSLHMKMKILEQISIVNEKQNEIISMQNMDEDAFQSTMEQKSELIDNIDKLDQGFESVYKRIKEQLEGNKQQYAEQIMTLKELIKNVTQLGASIEVQEIRNKEAVEKKFYYMKKEVQEAKRSKKMVTSYYQTMNRISSDPQFMDKKK